MKDKEWLKEQVNYLKEAVGKPAINDFSRGLNGAYDTLELLIDQLEEPEITEEQAWKIIAKSTNRPVMFWENMRDNYLSSLKEPELPVIPSFLADYIEHCKKMGWAFSKAITHDITTFTEVIDFLHVGKNSDEHQELFAKAWFSKVGYLIEKEPQYCIKLGNLYFKDEDEGIIICTQLKEYAFAGEGKEGAQETANKYGGTVEEWN